MTNKRLVDGDKMFFETQHLVLRRKKETILDSGIELLGALSSLEKGLSNDAVRGDIILIGHNFEFVATRMYETRYFHT